MADQSFNYQILSRLQMDCDYFLGCGSRNPKHLWALNVKDHIAEMYKQWEILTIKPDWITLKDIQNYAHEMSK